ncbi:BBE domain-containing protein [Kitasatospora sp. MAP5-34]|uniref:FAD-binding oxidoreductase n=1 Tax=Kitasatospora sp. MAP5-34 TaxID=3035102 RepID=UPI002473F72F|nr:BBE domain-containing protein [Kitasatospora sp. MAP5-34]MDH6579335.1 FAD/FMN-containing dehydrogenase [Kitasatospora sp. MAP5-34]
MSSSTRRTFLRRSAVIGGITAAAATVPGLASAADPATVDATGATTSAALGPLTFLPGDEQYGDLARGANQRIVASPDRIRLVGTSDEALQAVQAAVLAGERIAVRGGGHCFEDFVGNPEVKTLIDLSGLKSVGYDASRRAFAVEAGALLGEVYERLFKGWGVTIPGGSCPTVGVGGHIQGGGYGPLNRLFGLTVDHLYAIEVVVVNALGVARKVVATREPSDPNRDLWWAHTGGGGGNFGLVTKYWFRTPGATGTDPTALLPTPPKELLVCTVNWAWSDLNQTAFTRLLKNYSAWFTANNAPDSPNKHLYAHLSPFHISGGNVHLSVQLSAEAADPEGLLDSFLAAVNDGVGATYQTSDRRRLPWLLGTRWRGFADGATTWRIKGKSGYHRQTFTDEQAAAIYHHLTRTDYFNPGAGILIASYGAQVNAVAPDATALPHRDSALILMYVTLWADPAQDPVHTQWIRELYRDVYASTGGVPVPGDLTDGAYVNYADVDLADPAWNTSGVPWQTLYYKGNYPKLQQLKARWDPQNIFHHAQSITPAGT